MAEPRQFHAYSVGTSKSGTTSLAMMLARAYRSEHEPTAIDLIWKILGAKEGTISQDELADYIVRRDRELDLEFESSQLLLYILDILVETFPDAKFILTLRDCYSWLESVTNHELTRTIKPAWRKMADVRFRSNEFTHSKEEQVLADRGLYTLDGYLSYWAEHNETVLRKVPHSRLLIVKTEEIDDRIDRIADFLGIPARNIDASASHANKAEGKSDILSQIEPRLIEEKVARHCSMVMGELFPEIQYGNLG